MPAYGSSAEETATGEFPVRWVHNLVARVSAYLLRGVKSFLSGIRFITQRLMVRKSTVDGTIFKIIDK